MHSFVITRHAFQKVAENFNLPERLSEIHGYPTGCFRMDNCKINPAGSVTAPANSRKESREIKLKVLFKGERYAAFKIEKQTHHGCKFGMAHLGFPDDFAAHNGVFLKSSMLPCWDDGVLFVQGNADEYHNRVIEVSRKDFDRIEQAIKEYNEYFYVWKPIREYYGVVIRDNQARVECFIWNNSNFDNRLYDQGLAFKTRKEAETVRNELNEKYNSLLTQAVQEITQKKG